MRRNTALYKSIIFDLDGTLMNTRAGILKCLDCVVEKHGYPPIPEERKQKFIGPPMFQSLKREYGLPDEEAYAAAQEFRDLYANEYYLGARTYPMMRAMLSALRHEGSRLCVATYKREDVAVNLLSHFKLDVFFDAVYGSDFEGRLTKVDIIRKAMQKVNVGPANTVVVGDSKSDGIAAREIGTKFIAVTYGYGFDGPEDTREVDPVAICRHVEELYLACHKKPRGDASASLFPQQV